MKSLVPSSFFVCGLLTEERRTLASSLSVVKPDTIVEVTINREVAWRVVASHSHAMQYFGCNKICMYLVEEL